MLNLKEYREGIRGFSDLLNYAFLVNENTIINKDGSLMTVFEFQAPDNYSSTDEVLDALVKQTQKYISTLRDGWAVQFDYMRNKTNEYPNLKSDLFDDTVSQMIDLERRYFFENANLYTGASYITLTYLPPMKRDSRVGELMYEGGHKISDFTEKILSYFDDKVTEFQALSSSVLKIRRLSSREEMLANGTTLHHDELLEYINQCITGERHPVASPNATSYLDVLFGYEFFTGISPKIDKTHAKAISINGFPQAVHANILDALNHLDIKYRWNTKFVLLDSQEAIKIFSRIQKEWKQKVRGLYAQFFNRENGSVNLNALENVQQVDQAIASVESGVTYGYWTSSVVLFDENQEEIEINAREVSRIIETIGFNTIIEDTNAVEAYLGTLPAHITQNLRTIPMGSDYMACLLPLSTMWIGSKHNESDKFPPNSPALMYTVAGNTPFRFNLHVSDIGHTLIFGPTGSGKSTLLALLATQARRYKNEQIFAFDKGMSLYPLVTAARGDHYDIGGDNSSLAFAPFSNLRSGSDQTWAEDYLTTLVELQGVKPTPFQKDLINEAIKIHIEKEYSSLTELVSVIQDNDLRLALKHYTIDGSMGKLLDAESDNLSLSSFSVFEIEELMNMKEEDALPVLLYLFRMIKNSLDGRPSFLFLDEAWIMLGHPVFRDELKDWLKTLRKANCAVILATQSLSDASKSGILDVLQESCPTKILLPNPEAWNKGSENSWGPYDFYKLFGLNDREVEIVADATPKREYYYKSPRGTRLFDLALGEFTLSFVGASGKDDIAKIISLKKEYGDDWIVEWLLHRNVSNNIITYFKEIQDR